MDESENIDVEDNEEEYVEAPKKKRKGRKSFDDDEDDEYIVSDQSDEEFSMESDEDDDEYEEEVSTTKRKPAIKKEIPSLHSFIPKPSRPVKSKASGHFAYNSQYIDELSSLNPDPYWHVPANSNRIEYINSSCPLALHKTIVSQGAVYNLALSPDNKILASCTNLGVISLWDTRNWTQIGELRDEKEENIEEFYVIEWSDNGRYLMAAGKQKSRQRWSQDDDDNSIMPCPVKVFDVIKGEVVSRGEGHTEEVLSLKKVKFNGENFLLTSSEDGRFIKWYMDENYSKIKQWVYIDDLTTYMAVHTSFLPNCGNKYFVAACDDGIKLFDFEAERLVESWKNVFSYLCDCVKVVDCIDMPMQDAYLLSKGAELLSEENADEVMYPNKVILHKLTRPTNAKGKWELKEISRFEHDDFQANRWQLQLTSNGRYVVAPTIEGKIFVWNLKSNTLVTILKDHIGEVRDILFHPTERFLFTAGDDGKINVYSQTTPYKISVVDQEQ